MVGWPGIIAIISVGFSFIIMALDWVGPDVTFTILLGWLTAFDGKIITVKKASEGYGNSGLLTVIFLYLVAEGVTQTGGLELIMNHVLGRSRSVHWALVRSMFPVMFLSAFLNNTPCVTFMIPILLSWSRRCGVPPKKLLIPLSYAAVLGGTCTSIGTSTNLVIVGMQDRRYSNKKMYEEARFGMFDIAAYGVPYALWGAMFIIMTQRFLLPGNSSRYAKDLLLALRVLPGSPLVRKKLREAPGFRNQTGFSVSAVWRDLSGMSLIRSINPDLVLEAGDVLYVAGELDVVEYMAEEFGLGLVTQEMERALEGISVYGSNRGDTEATAFHQTGASPYKKLIQVTLRDVSDLVGHIVGEVTWQGRFGLIPIAIQRSSGREDSRLSDVVLAAEDVLILDTSPHCDVNRDDFKNNFHKVRYVKDGAAKEFIIGVKVKKSSEVVGKTVSAAGLRGIPGLYVLSLDRADGSSVEANDYLYKIQPDDIIWVAAEVAAVGFLSKFPGLELVQQEQVDKTGTSILYRHLVQAAVAHKGPLVGHTLRDIRFRSTYNAAVVAVHREGVRVPLKVQDIVLQGGDVLLLSCSTKWAEEHKHDKAFVLLQAVPDSSPPKRRSMIIGVLLLVGMVLTQIVGGLMDREYIHLWPAAVLTAALMLITGCMNADQARRSIMWDVYLTIAAAFGVSAALESTGVAAKIANAIISIGHNIGGSGPALIAIYIATAVMSELLTNNAAGAIMYPIAAIAGEKLQISPRDVSIAIMLGASAGFVNPFSYQCNLMVYAAGNYSVREFAIVGAPFQVWLMVVAGFILTYRESWRMMWVVSWCVTLTIVLLPGVTALMPTRMAAYFDGALDRVADYVSHRSRSRRRVGNSSASSSVSTSRAKMYVRNGSDSGSGSGESVPKNAQEMVGVQMDR